MKNLDVLKQKRMKVVQALQEAQESGDKEKVKQAFEDFTGYVAEMVLSQAEEKISQYDVEILNARGTRQLTSKEREYFQKLGEAMRAPEPKQALANMDVVMPKTVIDAVFEDLTAAHPLLDAIDFQNTSGLVEITINTDESQLGTWGTLTAEITKELSSGFKKIPLTLKKYSAFIPVAKAMLDLGPEWLETYVRTILQEAIYFGLEEGIVNGTGKDMPIGMNRDVSDDVSVSAGVYPEKDTIKVTDFDPVTYGGLLAKIAQTPKGKQRVVQNLILVVGPSDYYNKIMPATTIRAADGTYVNNVLPFPTTVIQSVKVPKGKAIIGLSKRYFMGVGTAKSGRIEFSDEYKFLEDERVYACKLYGHGEPKDDNAFLYLDISEMKPATLKVEVVKETENP